MGLQFNKRRERLVEIAFAVGINDMKLLPERTRGLLHVIRLGFSIRKIRIHEHPDYGGVRDQLAQQFQSLCSEITEVDVYPGGVAAWPTQAVDQSNCDRVSGGRKYNRNR